MTLRTNTGGFIDFVDTDLSPLDKEQREHINKVYNKIIEEEKQKRKEYLRKNKREQFYNDLWRYIEMIITLVTVMAFTYFFIELLIVFG